MLENHSGFRRVSYFTIMKKLTTEEFIQKAKQIHGDKYDYSKVNYVNSKTKVEIICPEHGSFHQTPNRYLRNMTCRKCMNNGKLTLGAFVEKSNSIHNFKYDYSFVKYKGNKTKVEIICPEHGSFWQTPSSHFKRRGCPICSGKCKYTTEEFIQKAQQIHNQKYDYRLVDYKNAHSKVKIICPEHGVFEQLAYTHLQGRGCAKCSQKCKIDVIEFEKRCNLMHNHKFNYSKLNYKNASKVLSIICPKHGVFKQNARLHMNGAGCPKCTNHISKPEIEVQDFIKSLGFKIKTNNRKILNGKELDIYIPELKKAIEFNGTYYHYSEKHFTPGKHSTKSKLCKSLNINLLHIREDLWKKDKEKMKKVIHKFLNFKN